MIWCWRPKMIPVHAPNETDYRCCFGCSSKIGFAIFTIINVIIITVYTILVVLMPPLEYGVIVFSLVPLIFEIVLLVPFFLALKTGKPVWMQIIWAYRLIVVGLLLLNLLLSIGLAIYYCVKGKIHWLPGTLLVIKGLLLFVYFVSLLYVTHRHYANLRDTRLWRDQTSLSRYVEAQSMSLQTQAPLAYPRQG